LTTKVSDLKFNHDSQMLLMSSRNVKIGFRVVHVPSFSVFANWPTARTPFNYVNCFDLSPKSGFLSVGNDKGKAFLYRLTHYDAA